MMKRYLITFLPVFVVNLLLAQGSFTLQQCLQSAIETHPLSKQNEMLANSSKLQNQIYDIATLPSLQLNAQATYQSDVTSIPISLPNISLPSLPHEQYKATVDVNELIYGAGIYKQQKIIENDNLAINMSKTESDLYQVKEKVSQLFMAVLLADKNMDVINAAGDELTNRINRAEAGVKNGILLQSSVDVLSVEILKNEQRKIELVALRKSLTEALTVLTGLTFDENSVFEVPTPSPELNYNNFKPEFNTFRLQQTRLDHMQQLSKKKLYPKLFGFGTGGFGNPALNMFDTDGQFFYLVGVKLNWIIWDWKQSRYETEMYNVSKDMISLQQQALDRSLKAQWVQYFTEIEKYNELIRTDNSIINMRIDILKSAAAQLENGTMTGTEYVTEQNTNMQAELSRNLHEIQLLQVKLNMLAVTGKL